MYPKMPQYTLQNFLFTPLFSAIFNSLMSVFGIDEVQAPFARAMQVLNTGSVSGVLLFCKSMCAPNWSNEHDVLPMLRMLWRLALDSRMCCVFCDPLLLEVVEIPGDSTEMQQQQNDMWYIYDDSWKYFRILTQFLFVNFVYRSILSPLSIEWVIAICDTVDCNTCETSPVLRKQSG